jgi:hypothetical protein
MRPALRLGRQVQVSKGLRKPFDGPAASIKVGRLDEGVDLPDLVRRQAQAEGWHLRSLAAVWHGLQKAWGRFG